MKCFVPATAAFAVVASIAMQTARAGFVTTSDTHFALDGEDFYVFGTNAYWASLRSWSETDLATIFNGMGDNNLNVCRTWGFNDVTTDTESNYEIYFQLWENGNATVNTGSTGLEQFDLVVAAAKAAGVKLVVPLVNNWSDYGGMDVYVEQLGGTYHDDFYTDETIKTAYKNYITTFVSRYEDEDTIMAWELCNECRCAGSGDLEESGSCDTDTLTDWMTEMSEYIKSIDSNHLVASGSEGFMNTDSSVYLYSGPSGVDFDANLAIDSIDYGTYHAYPGSWGVDSSEAQDWGVQWIDDHCASGLTAGKPVIMEEFGVDNMTTTLYNTWFDEVYAMGSGVQYWQFGINSLDTYDDGYEIAPGDDLFTSSVIPEAEKFAALSGSTASSTASSSTTSTTTTETSGSSSTTAATTTDESASSSAATTTTTSTTSSSSTDATVTTAPTATTAAPTATTTAPSTTTTTTTTTTDAPAADSDKCGVRRRRA